MEERIACNDAVPSGCPVKEAYTKKTLENNRGRWMSWVLRGRDLNPIDAIF